MEPNGAVAGRARAWPADHSGRRVRGTRGGGPAHVRRPVRPGGPWCPACERSKHGLGRVCKRRDCPGYVDLWMRDQRTRILDNLWSYTGAVCMVTLTPPGREELPWDRHRCTHAPGVTCSGTIGCRVVASYAREFNEQAMANWSSLWESVRVSCSKKFGPGIVNLLAYAPEPQQRGVIHFHVCLGASTPRERAALVYAAKLLAKRAPRHGWGTVDDAPAYQPLKHAGYAAAYLAKYLTQPEHAGSLRALVLDGQAPRRAIYVATRLTRRTRCTMRNLRARRYVWVLTNRNVSPREAELTVARWGLLASLRQLRGIVDREAVRIGYAPSTTAPALSS